HVVDELRRLIGGDAHALSRTLLDGNPAWPDELAAAAAARRLADDPVVTMLAIALSRTQDDFGNVRWTLFGASHDGAASPFWRSFGDDAQLARFLSWADDGRDPSLAGVRILAGAEDLPPFARDRLLGDAPLARIRTLLTFHPFP